jgi:hypothetical protein
MTESKFKPGAGGPRIASPALSTSTIFAADVRNLLSSDQAVITTNSPQAEDRRWTQQLQQSLELPFSSIVAASARRIERNGGLDEILEERPEAEPLIDLLDKQPENVPLPNSPSLSTLIESPNPRSAVDNQSIQDILDNWNSLRLQPPVVGSAQEQTGSGSTPPLVDYYLNQKEERSNRPSEHLASKEPSRAPSVLPPQPEPPPRSNTTKELDRAAEIYMEGYKINNALLPVLGPPSPIVVQRVSSSPRVPQPPPPTRVSFTTTSATRAVPRNGAGLSNGHEPAAVD